MEQAQREIASNWTDAYQKYVGPLPEALPGAGKASAVTTATDTTPAPPCTGTSAAPAGSCPADAPIKVSRSGIYHLPGTPQYDVTKARACFATPKQRKRRAIGHRSGKERTQ